MPAQLLLHWPSLSGLLLPQLPYSWTAAVLSRPLIVYPLTLSCCLHYAAAAAARRSRCNRLCGGRPVTAVRTAANHAALAPFAAAYDAAVLMRPLHCGHPGVDVPHPLHMTQLILLRPFVSCLFLRVAHVTAADAAVAPVARMWPRLPLPP